jgi:hypothetical protein
MEVPALRTPGQSRLTEALEGPAGTAVFLGRFSEQGQPVPLRLVLSNSPPEMPDLGYPPCYCIAGHGRSGTSLVASLLASGGLNIGQRLLGPNESNVRGHFEDMDFYDFHMSVLTAQGFGSEGYVLQPTIPVPQQFHQTAARLISVRRVSGKPWGWKDPRSVLFLEFWKSVIPELRFLLLFRAPWEVADSLFRRGDSSYLKNPNLAVRVWENYNRALLEFHDRFPRQCLLVESHAAAVAPQRLREAIAAKFGHYFAPFQQLYDRHLFTHENTSHLRSILGHFFPAAVELYHQLRARATLIHRSWEEAAAPPVDDPHHDWALQHWLDFRAMEKVCKRLQAQTAALEGALAEAQARAESLTLPRAEEAADLALTRTTIARLEQERTGLQQEQTRLEKERCFLGQERTRLEKELTRIKAQVSWMEGSRFWKLRRVWLRLKRLCGLGHKSGGDPARA